MYRSALLAFALLSAQTVGAQTVENTRPLVFLWAEDVETLRRQPLGSGFVLGPNGDVLTAKHVVESVVEGQRLVVSVASKSRFSVRVDMTDLDCAETQDFCLVRIPADMAGPDQIPAFYRLGCYVPQRNEPLVAAGFFGGTDPHAGVVTPNGAVIGGLVTGRLLPTSIPLEPGMSGGPVFDRTMTVVGLVKGGTTGGQFGFVQLLQPARSMLGDRGMDCTTSPEAPAGEAGDRLSGDWVDQFGSVFSLAEEDGRLTLQGRNGERVMQGTGVIRGRSVVVHITNNQEGGTISCSGTFTGDARLAAICGGPDLDMFDWVVERR